MTVGELKAELDDYGDHVEVVVEVVRPDGNGVVKAIDSVDYRSDLGSVLV